jgi:hypothetical protein
VLGERHGVRDEVPCLAEGPEKEQPSELPAGVRAVGAPWLLITEGTGFVLGVTLTYRRARG